MKTINQTSSYLSSLEMDDLGGTLNRFTKILASNRSHNTPIKDILIENINTDKGTDIPLHSALIPFTHETADATQIIDVKALKSYVDFLESPASKTMQYLDFLKENKKMSPSPSVHKNFIKHYGNVYDYTEQQKADPYLEEALKEIE